jgi:hypothetical protein
MEDEFFTEPKTIKETADKMMSEHLALVQSEHRAYNYTAWTAGILLLVDSVGMVLVWLNQAWVVFTILLLILLIGGLGVYQALQFLKNDLDMHLWFAERWKLLSTKIGAIEDEALQSGADEMYLLAVGNCLVAMERIVVDLDAYQSRKITLSLAAYYQQREQKNKLPDLIHTAGRWLKGLTKWLLVFSWSIYLNVIL